MVKRWLAGAARAGVKSVHENVELKLVGESRSIDRELVTLSTVASMVQFTGYLPHRESVEAVRQADLLFLPLHKLPQGTRATIISGKTYEYLATGRPILGALPDGDARDLLARAGTGLLCGPDDVDSMLALLRTQYQAWKNGSPSVSADLRFVQSFERRTLTRHLAAELHALCNRPSAIRSSQAAEMPV